MWGAEAGLLALALLAPAVAPAQTSAQSASSESLVFDFQAPPDCSSREAFEEKVGAFTRAARFDAPVDDPDARRLTIVIREVEGTFFGTLDLSERSTHAIRKFDAATCDEVVEALALATALALDPEALSGSAEAPVEQEPEVVLEEDEQEEEHAPFEEQSPQSPSKEKPPMWAFVTGVSGELALPRARARGADGTLDLGTYVRPGVSIYGELETRLGGVWSSWEGRVGYASSSIRGVKLEWLPSVQVGVCPVWWHPVGWLRVAPCGRLFLGRLVASPPSSVTQGQSATRGVAPTGKLLARAQFLFGNLRVSVEAGGAFPLAENTYFLASPEPDGEDETLLILTRHVYADLGISLGWQLF